MSVQCQPSEPAMIGMQKLSYTADQLWVAIGNTLKYDIQSCLVNHACAWLYTHVYAHKGHACTHTCH